MINIIKYLQDHRHFDLIKYYQDYGQQKHTSTQEIVIVTFSFGITKAQWIHSVPKFRAKFTFIQVTKIKSLSLSLFKA